MLDIMELDKFLNEYYKFDEFDDYCVNGLVVEGKRKIRKMVFGVSYNAPFLEAAVKAEADALLVHHGIFRKGLFSVKGIHREKLKILLDRDISLFGIHLPMDAHSETGHNALLLKAAGLRQAQSLKWGFFGFNNTKRQLSDILKSLHGHLHPGEFMYSDTSDAGAFNQQQKYGFTLLRNGPEVPEKVFMASGGSTDLYEDAVAMGADTFICGEIKEQVSSVSLETKTNFVNLGHYYSEKPGILALMNLIARKFNIETQFIEIPNPI